MQIGLGLSITAQLRFGSAISLSSYAVNDFDPSLVFDFEQNYYRTGGTDSTLSGSVTHAATSNATMTDSDGNIKWRPHNLVKYSEQFDNAAWAKSSNVTITVNDEPSPDGTLTAEKYSVSAATARAVSQAVTLVTGAYTVSIWFKAIVDTSVVFGTTTDNSTFPILAADGWQLISHSFTAVAGSTVFWFYDVSGVAGDKFYVWGAHVHRSDLGGMANNPAQSTGFETYVPTTSSAVYLPRVGHHIYNGNAWVNEGVLHESEARTNIVNYSNDFANAYWAAFRSVIATSTETDPAGGTSATKITVNLNGQSGGVYRLSTPVNSADEYTGFVMAKAGTIGGLQLSLHGSDVTGTRAVYNLTTGTVHSVGNLATANIVDMGAGWYLCSITVTASNQSGDIRVYFTDTRNLSDEGISGIVYRSDGTWTAHLYSAQYEQGSTPSSYIPTSGSTVTRAAETLTVPAANMPWPTPVAIGSELVTNGTFDTDVSSWTNEGRGTMTWTGSGLLFDRDDTITGAGSLGTSQTITTTAGKYYKLEFTVVSGLTAMSIDSVFSTGHTAGTHTKYFLGDGNEDFSFWPQNNLTSIVLDNISVKEINPLSVSIQMDGRMTYAEEGSQNTAIFNRWNLDASNEIVNRINTNFSSSGTYNTVQRSSGTTDDRNSSNSYYTAGVNVPFNIASRHGSTFLNGAVDGTALTANTTPTALPYLQATDLQLGYDFMGTIGKFRVWSDDLTDTGIATASAPSTEPSLQLTFDGSSTSSFTVLDWSE